MLSKIAKFTIHTFFVPLMLLTAVPSFAKVIGQYEFLDKSVRLIVDSSGELLIVNSKTPSDVLKKIKIKIPGPFVRFTPSYRSEGQLSDPNGLHFLTFKLEKDKIDSTNGQESWFTLLGSMIGGNGNWYLQEEQYWMPIIYSPLSEYRGAPWTAFFILPDGKHMIVQWAIHESTGQSVFSDSLRMISLVEISTMKPLFWKRFGLCYYNQHVSFNKLNGEISFDSFNPAGCQAGSVFKADLAKGEFETLNEYDYGK